MPFGIANHGLDVLRRCGVLLGAASFIGTSCFTILAAIRTLCAAFLRAAFVVFSRSGFSATGFVGTTSSTFFTAVFAGSTILTGAAFFVGIHHRCTRAALAIILATAMQVIIHVLWRGEITGIVANSGYFLLYFLQRRLGCVIRNGQHFAVFIPRCGCCAGLFSRLFNTSFTHTAITPNGYSVFFSLSKCR